MSISTVTSAVGPTVATAAATVALPGAGGASATPAAAAPVDVAPTRAPAPVVGFDQDVFVGIDAATNRKVYDIVESESGDSIQQIPTEAVLSLVAKILQQLEAEGLR
jgi:hypothetical protein